MATKGDRARLEPVARQLYVDQRKSLTEIEETLGVSRQTLGAWKAETKRPDQELDEWDRARAQKQSNIQRLKDLFDRQLQAVEETPPEGVTAPMVDALAKLGALVERWDKAETVIRKVEATARAVESGKTKSVTAQDLRQILKESYGLE